MRTHGNTIRFFLAATFLTSIAATTGDAEPAVKPKPGSAAQNANAQVELDTITVESGDSVGYLATRTSTATKTDTPLRDVPQSVSVVTKEQIKDIGAQRLEDVVRYIPGVVWHQGENNRDQVVIRGQSSTADFFVNGIRDDAQIFRDLYNVERVEAIKGPNALIFGRGGAGGVLNRVLKEADGVTRREVTVQGGSFADRRISVDAGGRASDTVSARINAVYEKAESYRDYVDLERYGINPTLTWTPTAATSIKLSYEYFHDFRHQDRGVPSQNGQPYFPAGYSTFFGNPQLSVSPATSHIVMAKIDHVFDSGLKVTNQTRYQHTDRFYQNVYPNGTSAVTAGGLATLAAYNNTNNRENLINQTDWTYKLATGPIAHTLLVGTEFAEQKSYNWRNTGFFPGNAQTMTVSAANPVSFVPVTFSGLASDARNRTNLAVAAVFAQDQLKVTRWLEFIAGVRFERFDLNYVNLNAQGPTLGQTFNRVDNLTSPRVGVVLKPIEPLSIYASHSVSYLPASGDQFNSLTPGLVASEPEKFVNNEIGVKYDIMPRLAFTAAVYQLDRTNSRFPDPANAGFFILSGATRARGLETSLVGYVMDNWQISAGYAYTDARIVGNTSATVVAGNRVALVPYNQFSLWNRYDFTERWGAGLGVVSMSDFYATSDDTVRLPAYTRVDGALFFNLNRNWKGQINVENLFGVRYYPTADANNNITPGSPRAIRVSVTGNL
ncbi:MAG: TonB-dependent siderophore receptor [Pseudolabrys sp.]|nr:TonB-dependent siderophore receptor [Pseudolabrys sp.]